jgi:uncharacterized heparinase superfamily protein
VSRRLPKGRLYLDSIARLKPRQLLARPRRLIPPRLLSVATRPGGLPQIRRLPSGVNVDHAPQGGPAPEPDLDGVFTAVGASREFGADAFWTDRRDGDLFLFHLHGFSALAAYAAGPRTETGDRFWRRVVEDWLVDSGRPKRPAWHPYPTSKRVLAWAAAVSAIDEWEQGFRDDIATEIWRQAAYLSRTVEHDIGGNHVLLNAVALCNAGALFERSRYLEQGLRLLRRELGRQLLADGGHEERSTSYTREVHEWLSDLERILRAIGTRPEWLGDAVRRSGGWMRSIAGPDGTLPLLNDAWLGPPVAVGERSEVSELAESGYLALRHGDDQAVIDLGPLCPPHLTPHAHADALSFVLWADGEPVVIDPGSFSYTGPDRDRFRSTPAHNTVAVGGRDQCEFWGDFRAAYLPRVEARPVRRAGDVVIAGGSHDGYRRLPDPVVHHRRFVWCPGDGLVVVDLLRGRGEQAIQSSLHLPPGAEGADAGRVGPFVVRPLGGGGVSSTRASYSPYLGVRLDSTAIEDRRTVAPETPFGWSLLRPGASVVELDRDRLVIERRSGTTAELALDWSA